MKKIISGFFIKLLGWKIAGEFPEIKKSVIIFAPHTSYYDGLFGKLYVMNSGIRYKFLSKKEFFKFPLKYFFRFFGSIPVYENKEYINQIVALFENEKELHIALSPEGQLAKTDHWKRGFYYMAKRANVPIVVGYMDYRKKEMGVKGVIYEVEDMKETMMKINGLYKNVSAKYPENFTLDKSFVHKLHNIRSLHIDS